MITRPYPLPPLPTPTPTTVAPAPELHWCDPQLQDNTVLTVIILILIMLTTLAYRHRGVMANQLKWLNETRNTRTFEKKLVHYPWIRPILLLQFFVSIGICLFCCVEGNKAAALLERGDGNTWMSLLTCIAAPLGWFLLQRACFGWFGYLFNDATRTAILSRVYNAIHVLLAPLALLALAGITAGLFSSDTAVILIASLFILSQIAFIFNGFKIFWGSFGATLIIIVYLCALEIAPLAVILTAITK